MSIEGYILIDFESYDNVWILRTSKEVRDKLLEWYGSDLEEEQSNFDNYIHEIDGDCFGVYELKEGRCEFVTLEDIDV